MAVLEVPLAVVNSPMAVARIPLAVVRLPMAVDASPLAVVLLPMAVARGPLAVVPLPMAVDSSPTLASSHSPANASPARNAPLPGCHIMRTPVPCRGITPFVFPTAKNPPSGLTCAPTEAPPTIS